MHFHLKVIASRDLALSPAAWHFSTFTAVSCSYDSKLILWWAIGSARNEKCKNDQMMKLMKPYSIYSDSEDWIYSEWSQI